MADAQRTLESSAHFTRGGAPPVPDHDATERQRAQRIETEQRRLIDWAKDHRKLGGRLPKDDVGGGEHIVRMEEKSNRVLKATQLGKHKGYGIALGSFSHGATPAEYLDRLNLQNIIFNDDIRLERVVLKGGKPVIVTSQPAIKGIVPAQAAIDETMAAKGFETLTPGAYYDERNGLLIFDLFPRNAMQAEDGVIYPFDPVIQRIQPDFADFLRANPDRIHNR
ncbi:MAG: hypothetical protein AB1705_00045 [Verrucomicrobiota bacterium]